MGACATFATNSVSCQQITLRGDVKDTLGATIKGAHILLRVDRAGGFGVRNTDQNLVSDDAGRFETPVGPGFYDVCVMADAFTPQCRKIFVKLPTPANQHFRLAIAPEVEKQIGDRFY